MSNKAYNPPWLSRYSQDFHAWRLDTLNGKPVFRRPLGLTETSFDIDGTEFGGRADMNALFTLEISSKLSPSELRELIILAWADLRLQHVMLMSRTVQDEGKKTKDFVVDVNRGNEEVLQSARESMVWVEDFYSEVDSALLYRHCLNVNRIVNPEKCMSRMHVLPLVPLGDNRFKLEFLVIMAHQTSDGLSAHNWFSHFLHILNTPISIVRDSIKASSAAEIMRNRLPPAQEDLYPKITGSPARQRWFWALLRVLRHKHASLPPTFTNPLRRETRRVKPLSFPPTFDKIFTYNPSSPNAPVLNCGHITASLSSAASARLVHLCRSANLSIGAGCFALAGLAMMEIHESRYPSIPSSDRQAFTASFPLNPRAFFGFTTPADSCMLAFSEGIVMPFLPSSLPIEGRFRLTAKHANRELKAYQKRKGNGETRGVLAPHSPLRNLATGYLWQLDRNITKLPEHKQKQSTTPPSPQGALPAATGQLATCGVSSMGSTAGVFRAGLYDLDDKTKDFVADFRGLRIGVRARENEFLVGSSSDWRGIVGFGVSYDESAISEEAAEMWARKVEELLEEGVRANL